MRKQRKTKRKHSNEKFLDLKTLPPNVMRMIVEKMSIEEHSVFRGVCVYAHDEVESYWRSQKMFSIPQLMIWFPSLSESEWKLNSLSGILNELTSAFNLFKPGNLRKLSFHRVLSVNIKSLIKCIELATGDTASSFLENVVELDLRGCFVPPDHIKLIDELFPNLQTIILHPNAIMPERNKLDFTEIVEIEKRNGFLFRKLTIKTKTEITHHIDISSSAKKTEYGNVPGIDMHLVAFVRNSLPDIKHVFIDLDS
ncbi:hypothetical protein CAEBREN_30515 [Caenorhabditis brenneri]|uniref:F-box domain-containing protein n=1 Tax=Caenorhabditis brenneri TaxID=135651 RepID=G0NYW5_CAEBE|nr:hypothetical protein CAEBREN_30515 [Caenorhabditis brenneri]